MTQHPVALAIALVFVSSATLSGCDRSANLTEQEHIQRAKDFEAKGDLKTSIIELKNAVQKAPNSPQARFLLGKLYVSAKLGSAAEKELTKARELGFDKEAIKVPLGEALLLSHDYKRLLEEIEPSAQTSPVDRARILTLHGDAKLGLRDWAQACELFGQALTVEKMHAPAHWGLAKCAVIEGKPDEARAQLNTAIKLEPNNPEAWIMLGDFERYSKNLPAAVEAYNTALKRAPSNTTALAERASTYIFMGQSDLASADIKKLTQVAPRHYMVDYLQALRDFRGGKTEEALSAVQKALQRNPGYPPAIYLLGEIQHLSGENEQAARTLGNYLRMLPGDQGARTLLARVQLALNQPGQALALLQPLLQANPTDAALLSLASQAQLQQRNPAAATATLQKAVALNPDDAGLRNQFGMTKLEAGDVDSAMAELNTASEMDKKRVEPLVALTLLHLQRKQYDLALDTLKQLQTALPDNPIVYNLFGVVHLKKADDAEARKQFERALALRPDYMAAAMNLAQMDLRDGKPQAAEARYKNVLAKDSDNLLALLALADLARAQKNEPAFLDLLARAVKAHPKAPQARLALAQHYLEKNDNQKALSEARQVLTTHPNNLDALDTMARVQLAMGDPESALSNYAKLAQLAPKSALAQYKYARVQWALKDERGARASLQRALKLQPVFHDAQAALGRLALQQKRPDEALSIARQMQQQYPTLPTGYALEGDSLMASKQYPAAAQRYEQAWRITPGGPLAVKLHAAYAAAGQPAAGEARLLQWLKQNPADNMARLFLAGAYAQTGQHRAAITQYEQVARADPNNPMVLNNLAWQLYLDGDARALNYAERAYALAPANPAVLDTLGWLLVQQKQTARGLGQLKQAAAKAPQEPEIRFHLAVALAQNGEKAQAKQELATLLRSGRPFPQRQEAQTLHDKL